MNPLQRRRPSALPAPAPLLVLLCLGLGVGACGPAPSSDIEPADLVLRNGKLVTVDEDLPEAEALAVRDDRITFVGTDAEVEAYVGPETEVVDLEGRLATPGFIEGHGHFMGIGNAKLELDLLDVTTWQGVVDRVEEAADEARPGELISGRGWHQSKMTDLTEDDTVRGFPTHHALSDVSRENPVILRHASGHATLANAYAMELAEVTADTPQPEGGEFIVDDSGEPVGVFVERASGLLGRARRVATEGMTEADEEARTWRQLELANEEVVSHGITSFQDAGSGPATIELFQQAVDQGRLDVRLWVMLRGTSDVETLQRLRMVGYGDDMLTVRALKMAIDGALGPRGAWLLEDYADDPGNSGHNTGDPARIEKVANRALENGYQLCVHAIGDRANREVLDIYERAFEAHPDAAEDARFRIEHAQHLHSDDIPRFAELGVIASMQGVHCTSDAPWVIPRLGEQRAREGAYVWRSLLDSGAVVINGTDAPVERVDPIPSFYASVTRETAAGDAFFPGQAMTREDALRSYTLDAAYAAFEEDLKGSLTPGKLADVVVWSNDIMTAPAAEILETAAVYTIVGGDVVYRPAR